MSIEEYLIEKLSSALSPTPVLVEVPASNPRPSEDLEEFYVIQKTGSSLSNHIQTSNIAIQSYAGTRLRAIRMNEALREAMEGLLQYGEIARVEFNSDYDYTDPETKQPRYQAVFVITHYDLG